MVSIKTPANAVEWYRVQILKEGRRHGKYVRSSAAARFVSWLTDDAIDRNKMTVFACASGCSHCCYVQTDVFAGEAFVLADAVRRMPEEQQKGVVQRLRENAEKLSGMSLNERLVARVPCALLDLDKGSCSVYADRPRACRRWHSLDAEACRVSVETQEGGSPVDPLAIAAADIVGVAYGKATKEPVGELHQGVLMALEEDSERRFARGEPVFGGWTSTADAMTEDEKRVSFQELEELAAQAERRTTGNALQKFARTMPDSVRPVLPRQGGR